MQMKVRRRFSARKLERLCVNAEPKEKCLCLKNKITPAPYSVTVDVGGRPLILETGKIAKQANGAIIARYGDTVVLTTACMYSTAE